MKLFLVVAALLVVGICNAQPCPCEYNENNCKRSVNVFFSYSRVDCEIVEKIVSRLSDIPYWAYLQSCSSDIAADCGNRDAGDCQLWNIKEVVDCSEIIVVVKTGAWDNSELCVKEKGYIESISSYDEMDIVEENILITEIQSTLESASENRRLFYYYP